MRHVGRKGEVGIVRQLERLATIWLWGKLLSDATAWLIALAALALAAVTGAKLWHDLSVLLGR